MKHIEKQKRQEKTTNVINGKENNLTKIKLGYIYFGFSEKKTKIDFTNKPTNHTNREKNK